MTDAPSPSGDLPPSAGAHDDATTLDAGHDPDLDTIGADFETMSPAVDAGHDPDLDTMSPAVDAGDDPDLDTIEADLDRVERTLAELADGTYVHADEDAPATGTPSGPA